MNENNDGSIEMNLSEPMDAAELRIEEAVTRLIAEGVIELAGVDDQGRAVYQAVLA